MYLFVFAYIRVCSYVYMYTYMYTDMYIYIHIQASFSPCSVHQHTNPQIPEPQAIDFDPGVLWQADDRASEGRPTFPAPCELDLG